MYGPAGCIESCVVDLWSWRDDYKLSSHFKERETSFQNPKHKGSKNVVLHQKAISQFIDVSKKNYIQTLFSRTSSSLVHAEDVQVFLLSWIDSAPNFSVW